MNDPVACPKCGKTFKSPRGCDRHQKNCSWRCRYCNVRISREEDVKVHEDICLSRQRQRTFDSVRQPAPSASRRADPTIITTPVFRYEAVPSTSRRDPPSRVVNTAAAAATATDNNSSCTSVTTGLRRNRTGDDGAQREPPKKKKKKPASERQFTCAACGSEFNTLSALLTHRRSHYNKPSTKRFVCHVCDELFLNRALLREHMKLHENNNSNNCVDTTDPDPAPPPPLDTQQSVPQQPSVRPMAAAAAAALPYVCQDCNIGFARWHYLQRHRLIFHAEAADNDLRIRGVPWETDDTASPPWESRVTGTDGESHVVIDRPLRDIYQQNRDLINSGHDTGRLRGIYNYPLNDFTGNLQDLRLQLETIYRREQYSFRINFSFGVILRHIETEELRYFTAYYNAVLLRSPYRINSIDDIENLMTVLEDLNILERVMRSADSTKWKKVMVTNINYFVYRTNFPIGAAADLPKYITDRHCIISFVSRSNLVRFEDNLCAFRCLVYAKTKEWRNIETEVKDHYLQWREYWTHRETEEEEARVPEDKKSYVGVKMQDLPAFEECFNVRVEVYTLKPDLTCSRVYRSSLPPDTEADAVMTVNLHAGHFSVIKNLEQYAKKYCCRSCSMLYDRVDNMRRHEKTCNNRVSYTYPGGLYKPGRSIFEELEEDIGVATTASLRHFPFFAVYDFESVLLPTEEPIVADDVPMPKSKYVTKHMAVCVSICSNVEGFKEPHSIVDPDLDSLVESMMIYLERIQEKAKQMAKSRWRDVILRLQRLSQDHPVPHEDADDRVHVDDDHVVDVEDVESDVHRVDCVPNVIEEAEEDVVGSMRNHKWTSLLFAQRVKYFTDKFDAYCESLPVLGFNSSNYDLNLIKEVFPKHLKLVTEQKFVVKKNNQYSAIATKKFRFLDIANFLAPGSSYSKFLAAYDCEDRKGYLCYEWFDHPDKLQYPRLPDYDCFYSKLKGENVLESEYIDWEKKGGVGQPPMRGAEIYAGLQETWRHHDMKTFSDYLQYYADLDTGPFVEGVEKMSKYYFEKGVDLFKIAISAPGVARKLLFEAAKKEGAYFSLFSEGEADLYHKLKKCAVGGPSIIFTRHAKAGETLIRGKEQCSTILGFDSNAMYLKCMDEELPVLFPIRRRSENGFKPEVSWGQLEMFQWLEWRSVYGGRKIYHKLNSSREFRIGPYLLDGWCIEDDHDVDAADASMDHDNPNTQHADRPRPVVSKAFEFHGCWTHGHAPEICGFRQNGRRETSEDTRKILAQRAERTKDKEQFITSLGVELEVIYECEFAELKKYNPEVRSMINDMLPSFYTDHPWTVDEDLIKDSVEDGSLTGLVEVDIHVPDQWPTGKKLSDTMTPKEYFSEMSPIFCNSSVHYNEWGPTMQQYSHDVEMDTTERKLLIGGTAAERLFLATNLLQWYLKMGLEVTKVHQVVEYKFIHCFNTFCHDIADARRKGDADPSKEILGETCKVIGNASYGSLLLDKTKHINVKYMCDPHDAHLAVNDVRFKSLTELSGEMYEVEMLKRRIKMDVPIQLAFCILQTAKLILLKFYYQCLDHFVDRSKFQATHCDTDSIYIALSTPTFREAVRPERLEEYDEQISRRCYDLYQEDASSPPIILDPNTVTDCMSACIRSPAVWFPRDCCTHHKNFDRRVPGLFKLEASGTEIIALASKTYHLDRGDNTQPAVKAKGVNKRSLAAGSKQLYYDALFNRRSGSATNIGFRAHANTVQTYTQSRVGFSFFYVKRQVLPNGIDTIPLPLVLCPWEDHNVVVITPEESVLSNDYHHVMIENGVSFRNVTQMYLYKKAVFNGCGSIADKILKCKKLAAMRRIASFIQCKEEWFGERERTMIRVLNLKREDLVHQMTEALERCVGKNLVHPGDRHDLYWTSGMDAALSSITAPCDFKGANSMGILLMKLYENPGYFPDV